jgi:hypothetical protein
LSACFDHCSELIKLAYTGTTLLLYVHDFQDGRVCFMYGYLDWHEDTGRPFARDVSHSYQDTLRSASALAQFTLFPCLPLNPLAHIHR